jgi:hypothetical protein
MGKRLTGTDFRGIPTGLVPVESGLRTTRDVSPLANGRGYYQYDEEIKKD